MGTGPSAAVAGEAGEPRIWGVRKAFGWLLGLTAVEVAVAYLPLSRGVLAFLLVAGALVKAAIVALHFMHLRIERRWLLLVLGATAILAGVFVLGLVPDLVYGPGSAAGGE